MPAPGAPETVGRVAFFPGDCSPSRARLGRVAAMLREAEEAVPVTGRRQRAGHDAVVVDSLLPRRVRTALPRPRTGAADAPGTGHTGALGDVPGALRRS